MGKHGPAEVVEFNGTKYRRYPHGTNVSMSRYFSASDGEFLHRAIWSAANGPIPKGMHVHHLDGNHSNNALENLALINGREHLSMHGRTPERAALSRDRLTRFAQPAATEWHKSDDGRDWHRGHAAESINRIRVCTCDVCGAEFTAKSSRAKRCSADCKRIAYNKWMCGFRARVRSER